MTQQCSVFLATGLVEGDPDREPAEHDMVSAWFIRSEVARMTLDGRLSDSKSLAALAFLHAREQSWPAVST